MRSIGCLLLLGLGMSSAFVVSSRAISTPRPRAIVSAAERDISVSPSQGLVIGGGTIGILGAAFCTSTGSPPTGLAVAIAGLLFMAAGSRLVESEAPPPPVVEKPIEVSQAQGVVIAGGTIGILGAAFCTSTGSPPTGLAVAVAGLLFMAAGSRFIEA